MRLGSRTFPSSTRSVCTDNWRPTTAGNLAAALPAAHGSTHTYPAKASTATAKREIRTDRARRCARSTHPSRCATDANKTSRASRSRTAQKAPSLKCSRRCARPSRSSTFTSPNGMRRSMSSPAMLRNWPSASKLTTRTRVDCPSKYSAVNIRPAHGLQRNIEIESRSCFLPDGTDFVRLGGNELLQVPSRHQADGFQLKLGQANHGPRNEQAQCHDRQRQIADADPHQAPRRHIAFDAMFANPRVAPYQIGDERMKYRPNQQSHDEQSAIENPDQPEKGEWIRRGA